MSNDDAAAVRLSTLEQREGGYSRLLTALPLQGRRDGVRLCHNAITRGARARVV